MARALASERDFSRLLRETLRCFHAHAGQLPAAIAFFMLLSVAPLLVISVDIASLLFDQASARAGLLRTLQVVLGASALRITQLLLEQAAQPSTSLATLFATLMLGFAASRLFVQVQAALNAIWGVREAPTKRAEYLRHFAWKRLVSLIMVLACGAVLLASLALQMLVASLEAAAARLTGIESLPLALSLLEELALVFVPLVLLFSLVYRLLPDARVRLLDVWVGALLSAVLTLIGTRLVGLYFTKVASLWLQGAAGAAAAFMLWTYYLAHVFLLGAAFTRVWSTRHGERVRPSLHALSVE
jgi:membrane protein